MAQCIVYTDLAVHTNSVHIAVSACYYTMKCIHRHFLGARNNTLPSMCIHCLQFDQVQIEDFFIAHALNTNSSVVMLVVIIITEEIYKSIYSKP